MKWTALALSLTLGCSVQADEMTLAVTTSFHNSGLSDVLLPEIRNDLDLEVHLLVVGTGQALRLGRRVMWMRSLCIANPPKKSLSQARPAPIAPRSCTMIL